MQARYHFVFYANASAKIGAGHIMRLMAIAQVCITQSIKVSFVYQECPEILQARLRAENFELCQINSCFSPSDIQQIGPDVIFIDDYHVSEAQWQVLKNSRALLVNLDDNTHNNKLNGDIVINPSASAKEEEYKSRAPNAVLCLGAHYTYLRQEFADQRYVGIEAREQVLLTLGGADVKNMAYWLTKGILKKLPKVKLCLLTGGLNTSSQALLTSLTTSHPNLSLVENSQHVANIMMRSGLAISAGGGTLGELASMGVPTIALVSVNNQMGALTSPLLNTWYRAIDVRHFEAQISPPNINAENQNLIDEIISQVYELWRDICKRERMSEQARQIIDSHGCTRIVRKVIEQLT